MPNPVNEDLDNWQPDHAGNDSNDPESSDPAGEGDAQDLAGNLRLIKSVVRGVSIHMSWERWLGVKNLAATGNIAFTYSSGTVFTVNDDWTATGRNIATLGRRVRATITGAVRYGAITAASFSSPNTTITVAWDSGSIDATLSEVELGIEHVAVGGLQGRRVSQVAPTNGQALAYNTATGLWEPTTISTHAEDHRARHISGGADAFLSTDVLEAIVKRLLATGPVTLTVGAVADGEFLKRDGSSIVSAVPAPPSASVGTGQLKTSTGSATGTAGSVNVQEIAMNDYSFFPGVTHTGADNLAFRSFETADPGDTVGRFGVITTSGSATYTVRWRYITASDDPTIWIMYDGSGNIVGVWVSDDPLPNGLAGIKSAGLQSRLFKAPDLAQIGIPANALQAADARIEQARLRTQHRLYRALQELAADPAPSRWIFENCRIGAGNRITAR